MLIPGVTAFARLTTLLVFTMVSVGLMAGGEPGDENKTEKEETAREAVFYNQRTGEAIHIAGTTEAEKEILRLMQRPQKVAEHRHEDKGQVVHLQGGFNHVSVIQKGATGEVVRSCVSEKEEMESFLSTTVEEKVRSGQIEKEVTHANQ